MNSASQHVIHRKAQVKFHNGLKSSEGKIIYNIENAKQHSLAVIRELPIEIVTVQTIFQNIFICFDIVFICLLPNQIHFRPLWTFEIH